MSSFVTDLSVRLKAHTEFWAQLRAMEAFSARRTIASAVNSSPDIADELIETHVDRLLFCASVFVQSDQDADLVLAQSIAMTAAIAAPLNIAVREKAARILAQLGNFPGLIQLSERYGQPSVSLLGLLNRRLSEALNSVEFGQRRVMLTDYQLKVWSALPTSKRKVISAPTSAGKSFLVLEYLCRAAESREKFCGLYLAPTRALLAEIHQKVSIRLEGIPNTRVSTVPSLSQDQTNQRQIFVLTQERLQVLLSLVELSFEVAIVDEVQNVSDSTRGMILQECLERLITINPNMQLFMLAPGASGFEELSDVIGLGEVDVAETRVSPVLQNRVLVERDRKAQHALHLKLLARGAAVPIGTVRGTRGFAHSATRLAAIALELGGDGGSLVYATGPKRAEDIARQLATESPVATEGTLAALSEFITRHIHHDYTLAALVRHGVAFHYGRMPSLLREAIESAFRSGDIKYLSCTTTLFQGVNLPARNVFIDTPTRGQGTQLDAAALWNFAGRAGRLGKDIVGNVFLVDYDQWSDRPLDQAASYQIRPAVRETISAHYNEVLAALSGEMPTLSRRDESAPKIRAVAGLLISHAAKGGINAYLGRVAKSLPKERLSALALAAEHAARSLSLPLPILEAHWTIDPFGLVRLHRRLLEGLRAGEVEQLIPPNPFEKNAHRRYAEIFARIEKYVNNAPPSRFGGLVASLAVPWMRGEPYPKILAGWIRFKKAGKGERFDVDGAIRQAFELIEDVVRFRFVQLGKAYVDLLLLALEEYGAQSRRSEVFDFALALELGVSTQSGRAFVDLGLSRITATTLESLFPNSELSVQEAREHIRALDVAALNISPMIIGELDRLGLLDSRKSEGEELGQG